MRATGTPLEIAAWTWANYTEPTEVLAPLPATLTQPLKIMLMRPDSGRQQKMFKVLNAANKPTR